MQRGMAGATYTWERETLRRAACNLWAHVIKVDQKGHFNRKAAELTSQNRIAQEGFLEDLFWRLWDRGEQVPAGESSLNKRQSGF